MASMQSHARVLPLAVALFTLVGCGSDTAPAPFVGWRGHASLELEVCRPDGTKEISHLGKARSLLIASGFGCADSNGTLLVTDQTEAPRYVLDATLYTTSYFSLGTHDVFWGEPDQPYYVAFAEPTRPYCIRPVAVGFRVEQAPDTELVGADFASITGQVTVDEVWREGLPNISLSMDIEFREPISWPGASLRIKGTLRHEYVDERDPTEQVNLPEPNPDAVPSSIWDSPACQAYLANLARQGCVSTELDQDSGGAGGSGPEENGGVDGRAGATSLPEVGAGGSSGDSSQQLS